MWMPPNTLNTYLVISTAGASTPVRYESKCKPNISPVSSGKPWESVQLFWLLRYYVQEY